jgi:hypothetical protein
VIFSRSMSQVSEMMFATVSKVEDIGNPLKSVAFWQRRRSRGRPPAERSLPRAPLIVRDPHSQGSVRHYRRPRAPR